MSFRSFTKDFRGFKLCAGEIARVPCWSEVGVPRGRWKRNLFQVLAAGPHAPRGASAGSHGRPPQTEVRPERLWLVPVRRVESEEAEKTLSALLQHLRIPHVTWRRFGAPQYHFKAAQVTAATLRRGRGFPGGSPWRNLPHSSIAGCLGMI